MDSISPKINIASGIQLDVSMLDVMFEVSIKYYEQFGIYINVRNYVS